MSVRFDNGVIHLEGDCRVEDAEPLLALLQAEGSRMVDLAGARALHTAVVQILIALQPPTRGSSSDAFVRAWIEPLLSRVQAADAAAAPSKPAGLPIGDNQT